MSFNFNQISFSYSNNNLTQIDEKYIELSFGINDGKLLIAIISTNLLYEYTGFSHVVFLLYIAIGLFIFSLSQN